MKVFIPLFIILFCQACIYDYTDQLDFKIEKKIILNCLLNPDSLIRIQFRISKEIQDTLPFSVPDSVYILLKENDQVIFDTICIQGEILLKKYPQPGYRYSLTASSKKFPEIAAETSVPKPIRCEIKVGKMNDFPSFRKMDIIFPDIQHSSETLWLNAISYFQHGQPRMTRNLHCNNLLIDEINKEINAEWINPPSPVSYTYFIRLAYPVTQQVDTLTIYAKPVEGFYNVYKRMDLVCITASREYDRYFRSAYQQLNYSIETNTPFSYESIHIESNIRNGLGIFAGYSQISQTVDSKN